MTRRIFTIFRTQLIVMKNTILIALSFCFFLTNLQAQHTFSIVAADPATGEVGSAGASCVDGAAQLGGVHIISQLVPNRGGINAQAWICTNPNINLNNGITQMIDGLSPDEIISYLQENDACFAQNFNPDFRQYGIVDFDENGQARSAGFTGTSADDYKDHILGPNYAIQGNILLGPEVLEQMEQGFLNTSGTLAEKLMGAIQGANLAGADSRCLDRGSSSTSAYLKVTKPDDEINDPYLFLNIPEMPFGMEPIDSLQTLFNAWFTSSVYQNIDIEEFDLYPNPTSGKINLHRDRGLKFNRIEIFNNFGKLVKAYNDIADYANLNSIDISEFEIGVYIVKIKLNDTLIGVEKVIRI